MIRVVLPHHLQTLAHCEPEVQLDVSEPVTPASVLDSLEKRYPMLRGAVIDHNTGQRRPLIRFFVCQQDISHQSMHNTLPEAIIAGREPFLIIGAIAGG